MKGLRHFQASSFGLWYCSKHMQFPGISSNAHNSGECPAGFRIAQITLGFLKGIKRRMWDSSPHSEGLASFCSLCNESPQMRENTLCNRSLAGEKSHLAVDLSFCYKPRSKGDMPTLVSLLSFPVIPLFLISILFLLHIHASNSFIQKYYLPPTIYQALC